MRSRWDSIRSANPDTYEWMFATDVSGSPPLRFAKWLAEEEGIFWVTGKAGSGKSTLMKHVSEHPETQEILCQWASSRSLVIVSHYFWYLGTSMQKSYEGLLRSILHDILAKCPDLIEQVCKSRWADELAGREISARPWSNTELLQCVSRLADHAIKSEGTDICFCFFIDGLDEYDGDHRQVIDTLSALAQGTRFKICASSRPWNVFQDAFETSRDHGNWLELHLYTKNDIATVVEQELGGKLARRYPSDPDWQLLVKDVIDRSQGVFLWVTLVIMKELVPCLENREDIGFMLERLRSIPEGMSLDNIGDKMLTMRQIYLTTFSGYSPGSGRIRNTVEISPGSSERVCRRRNHCPSKRSRSSSIAARKALQSKRRSRQAMFGILPR